MTTRLNRRRRTDVPKMGTGSARWRSPVRGRRALPGEFTFTAHQPGAVGFEYSFDWGGFYERIDVGPDGTATLPWTPEPDDELRFYTLKVRTVTTDGTASMGWTPPATGQYVLVVYGTTADGTRSAGIGYSIYVN
jgi:hypothetical protein